MKKEIEGKKTNTAQGKEEEPRNTIERLQHFIYEYRNIISYVSIAVIILVLVGFWLKGYLAEKNQEDSEKAMVALTRIYPYYDAPDYRKALFGDSSRTIRGERVIGLLEILDKYSGTDQAYVAAFYAGNSYLALDQADNAIEYFEISLNSPSKTVIEGSYAGLGACYELKGNYEEAADYYEKAASLSIDETTKARYSYYAAVCFEKNNNKEKAINIYKDIMFKNRYNEFGNLAKGRLARLGTIIE